MPKRALPRLWPLNKMVDRGFSHVITERALEPVLATVDWNAAAFSHAREIACNSRINLSVEASICRTDAFYTKLKSRPLWQSIIEAQVIVADLKKRGIPKV